LQKEWACTNNADIGYANKYSIGLKVLDLRDERYSILNCIAILIKHRIFYNNNPIFDLSSKFILDNYYINVDDYDIII